jgi:hypothetical protein
MQVKNGLLFRRDVSGGWAGDPASSISLLFRLSFLIIVPPVLCTDKERVEGDVRVNFGDIGGIGWVVESYIAAPEGRNAVNKYLTSPEGIAMLQKFVGTPEGKETIVSILPHILDGLNLPPGSADTIRGALGSTQ